MILQNKILMLAKKSSIINFEINNNEKLGHDFYVNVKCISLTKRKGTPERIA